MSGLHVAFLIHVQCSIFLQRVNEKCCVWSLTFSQTCLYHSGKSSCLKPKKENINFFYIFMLTFQIASTDNSSNNNNNNNSNNNDCHNIFFQIRFFLATNYSLKFTNFLNIFQQFHDENILFETTYIFYLIT